MKSIALARLMVLSSLICISFSTQLVAQDSNSKNDVSQKAKYESYEDAMKIASQSERPLVVLGVKLDGS
jgi:hypothetical protein